jgi:hypothetical protein
VTEGCNKTECQTHGQIDRRVEKTGYRQKHKIFLF